MLKRAGEPTLDVTKSSGEATIEGLWLFLSSWRRKTERRDTMDAVRRVDALASVPLTDSFLAHRLQPPPSLPPSALVHLLVPEPQHHSLAGKAALTSCENFQNKSVLRAVRS